MDRAVKEKSCLKQNWIMNIKDQSFEYVFLGSSRAENMLDAGMVERQTGKRSLNIAVSGCGHEELHIILKIFLSNGNRFKYLFYQNDIYGFQNKAGVNYHFHDYAFLPYLYNDSVSAVFKDVVGGLKLWFWKYVPYSKYAEFNIWYPIKYLWSDNVCQYKYYDGFGSAILSENNQGALGVERLFVDTTFQKKYHFDAMALKYVKKNLKLAKDSNIKVITYTAPEYMALYKTQINREEMNNKIDSLSESFGAKFFLFEDETICYNDSLFVDYSHLNAEGTRAFTQLLIDSVVNKLE
tara:strand:+ start:1186 stop:2070 length:885 start_codon:yes stop_codon:yes gene_type:complete